MNQTTSFHLAFLALFIMAPSSLLASEAEPCPGDFDASFAIDVTDHVQLANCLTGPAEIITNPTCLPTDLHRNHHVDLRDFAAFQNKLGPCHLCAPEWAKDQFCLPGLNGKVSAMSTWDDGNGPALYVGGDFTIADCANASNIAKWDGSSWSPLGTGMNGNLPQVLALTVFDDGTGTALYAGGIFFTAGGVSTNYIAKWDGSSWSPLGTGMNSFVYALRVFDDGTGPALYAGGLFTSAGGVPANRIAKWDGSSWSRLDSGLSGGSVPSVSALSVFNNGTGSALYAGGRFTAAGSVAANHIAKWDGSSWSPLGMGMNSFVYTLTVFDDSTGPALYAGGDFTTAGEISVNHIAKWNGSSWSPLGSGLAGPSFPYVYTLTVFGDGTGPALYAGGNFTAADGLSANYIAKWDGSSWAPLGTGMNQVVRALTVFDDGTGPALYAGGVFNNAGGVPANHIGKWDSSSWSPLGTGAGMNYYVNALTVFDDSTGPALYAGGGFTTAGGVSASYIAKWDGSSWSPLGTGIGGSNPNVNTLTIFDDGTGPALYAGGKFTAAGGVLANHIAKWDGSSWSPLGTGMNTAVHALTVFDDGTGQALYAGGIFTTAGGVSASYIAKWDGSSWSPLGTGMNTSVRTLTVFDDGTGPALYAGGNFTAAGGLSANHIAKWNGSSWSPLETGINNYVTTLTGFDDGTGPALYAGGNFSTAGGFLANRIAKWDGSSWSPLGTGMNIIVYTLTGFDDGTGPALYAGGDFTTAGGISVNRIAKWNGSSWSPLGSGLGGSSFPYVYTLTDFDDGTGPALFAGGVFTIAGGNVSAYLAKWQRPNTCSAP